VAKLLQTVLNAAVSALIDDKLSGARRLLAQIQNIVDRHNLALK